MRIAIIMNPKAGLAEQIPALRQAVTHCDDIVLHETSRPGQATALAVEAMQAGAELVVAAGGDGTVNEVVNGLATDFTRARLGIIPLGTGNDLARTLAIPLEPLEALRLLKTGEERSIDVVQIESVGRMVYGVNMAIGGFTGQMNEVLTDELKANWGPLAYLLGAAQVVPDLSAYTTTVTWDEDHVERLVTLNIAVANGRTAAGGLLVAPTAALDDGLLDVVIVRYTSLLDVAAIGARFLAGTYLDSEEVLHRQVRRLHVASQPGMWFNVDGELLTNEPLTFSVQPQALRVVVHQV
jgi:diacylglycerol kinase (ATP)